jgi:hypothetical protein
MKEGRCTLASAAHLFLEVDQRAQFERHLRASACAASGSQNIMKTLRSALRPVVVAVACASIAACADSPPRQTSLDYRSRPSPTTQGANGIPGLSDQRLAIQSGGRERLNLPWFIQDTQGLINSN